MCGGKGPGKGDRTKWAKEFGRKPRVTVWKLRIALLGTSVQLLFVPQRI